MKTISLIILVWMFVAVAYADQISYSESSLVNQTDNYYTSNDRRIQYNRGDDKYLFLQYRRAGICPRYCGFNYYMIGLGLGKYHDLGFAKFFTQAGYYRIENSEGYKTWSELGHYYLNARFSSPDNSRFYDAFEVKNDNSFGVTLGIDVPYSRNFGFKFSYQYMKVKENIIGYIDGKVFNHDPRKVDLSTISAGIYWNF